MEYESSFFIHISPLKFQEILNSLSTKKREIVIYLNDNIRIVNNTIQQKVTKKLFRSLYIHKDDLKLMFLIRRQAIEMKYEGKINFEMIKGINIRYCLFRNDKSRICIEKQVVENGCGQYLITAEYEYASLDEFETYSKMIAAERALATKLIEYTNLQNINYQRNFDTLFIKDILQIPSRKFHKLYNNILSKEEIFFLKKHDGYKCIFYRYKDKIISFGMFKLEINDIVNMNIPENLIFAGEVLNDKIVLIDIIGAYYQGKLYMPDPRNVLYYFEIWYKENSNAKLLNLPIDIQRIIYPVHENFDNCDGMIIIQDNKIFKFKTPTVDILIKSNGYAYAADNHVIESDFLKIYSNGEMITPPPGIYEVMVGERGLHILRTRKDRIYPCSVEEYEEFKLESKFFYEKQIEYIKKQITTNNSY